MTLIARLLVIVLLPFVLLLTSARFVMSHAYARWEYGKPDFPKATRINDTERLTNALASIDFVTGQASEAEFRALRVNGQPAWNEREVQHMIDVRVVTGRIFTFHLVALALVLASLLVLRGRRAARALQYGSLLTVLMWIVLGIFAAVSFNQFFTLFHALFFEGDTWIFDYEDTLIQLFPIPFWFDAALLIVGSTISMALLIGVFSAWALRSPQVPRGSYRPRPAVRR